MENKYYMGIDLDDTYAVVSYYLKGMNEPETLSPIAGSEKYQIPISCAGNTKEEYKNTLKKLFLMASRLGNPMIPDWLAVTMESITKETAEKLEEAIKELGIESGRLFLLDRCESFYYYVYSQKEELFLHDVGLFDYRRDRIRHYYMKRNPSTVPQIVEIRTSEYSMGETRSDPGLDAIVKKCLNGKICSSVFLTGDGFDGNWMKQSLVSLCRGRKAFIGKNLYAKGACYGALVKREKITWPYLYLGENEMKMNFGVKARFHGELAYVTLIEGGESRFEASGECECLIKDTETVCVWMKHLLTGEEKKEELSMTGFMEGQSGVSRIRIEAKAVSDREVQVKIRDLGFGEITKCSEQSWEYRVSL